MPSVGDVFVTLRLDTTGFQAGVTNAAASAARLGQVLDQFGRPLDRVANVSDATGDSIERIGGVTQRTGVHFHNASQQIARFAAVGIEQVIPSAQGSRVAIEGVLRAAGGLAGTYGAIAVAGAGLAAILGGVLFNAFTKSAEGSKIAKTGVETLKEQIDLAQKDLDERTKELERTSKILERLQRQGAGGTFGTTGAGGEAQRKAAEAQAQLDRLKGLDAEAASMEKLRKQTDDARKKFTEIETAVQSFVLTSARAAVDDPLQKLLIDDFQRAQDLIVKIRELTVTTVEERDKVQSLIGQVGSAAGQNQRLLRDQFSKQQGPVITESLGLGAGNLIAGLRDIEQTTREVSGFASEIDRLSRLGIPARDLFNLIAEGQQKVDERIGSLREKFADVPIILEKIADLDKQFGQGSLQKGLDAVTRGFQNLKQGGFELETEMTQVTQSVDSFIPAASDAVTAADAMGLSVVRLTQGWRDFKFTLDAVIGSLQVLSGGEVAVAGPGNFQ